MPLLNTGPGIAKIKNVSGAPYDVEEMPGVTIPDQGEIDLLDTELVSHYTDYPSAKALLTKSEGAQLRQDIIAGNIEIVELRPGWPFAY